MIHLPLDITLYPHTGLNFAHARALIGAAKDMFLAHRWRRAAHWYDGLDDQMLKDLGYRRDKVAGIGDPSDSGVNSRRPPWITLRSSGT